MRRILLLLAVLAATSLLGAPPTRAQLRESPDCTDEYVRSFTVPPFEDHPGWSPGRIQCRVYFDLTHDTPAGLIQVRGIGDENVQESLPPGGVDAIEAGVREALSRLSELGDYDLDDTTFLISAIPSARTDIQPRTGYSDAWTVAGASRAGYVECHVTLFIQTDYSAAEIRYAVAHELFHCVQKATLSVGQNASQSGRGLWWVEGSAEWFAALVAGPQERWARAPRFERAVARGDALYEMSYQMAVFFYWYHQAHGGAGAILPFLHRMSEGGAAIAQEIAMQRVLSEDEWLAFAQAYDQREINYPRGGRVSFGQPPDGETFNIEGDGEHAVALKPFVITLGWAEYQCGRWNNTATDANLKIRRADSDSWARWPSEIDARDHGAPSGRYRFVGMPTTHDGATDFTLNTRRIEACTECVLRRATIDRCVVGRWRLTAGGPTEYLRSRMPQGMELPRLEQSDVELIYADDGTFRSEGHSFGTTMVFRRPGDDSIVGETDGVTRAMTGRWAAEGSQLYSCIDGGGSAESFNSMVSGGAGAYWEGSSSSPAGAGGSDSYTCSDTTLSLSSPMPSGDVMTQTYTRLTPAPRRRR
ncbi:hypothetical protein [Terricaulis sp.]|uniref:hypothetical protein n=1 Tax=Terricaulis sp. TaxID=2768686 RepID=UPI0037839146